jgi:hypothetical protein
MKKTAITWNPDKNYLGNWDIPEDEDLILTIQSAKWEEVKNPQAKSKEVKRVVTFKEDFKPMICNETNAKSIEKVSGKKYLEDLEGIKISLFSAKVKAFGEIHDALRIRDFAPKITVDPQKAIAKLRTCNTVDELRNVFTALAKEEQGHTAIITVKNELKEVLV